MENGKWTMDNFVRVSHNGNIHYFASCVKSVVTVYGWNKFA